MRSSPAETSDTSTPTGNISAKVIGTGLARSARSPNSMPRATLRKLSLAPFPAAAIHLYEKLGFQHDAEIMARHGARYQRCDVAMRYHEEVLR
ncbi:hypothetical protein [Rhodanobacter thiooxydans]|uniref:hypothetical protein n=1 Tax=Rhodanobacter thiooxydans TaxID=416169 RepID=UPI001F414A6F|nr:hypothetical protein [Rhodanobacter thiooxydans]